MKKLIVFVMAAAIFGASPGLPLADTVTETIHIADVPFSTPNDLICSTAVRSSDRPAAPTPASCTRRPSTTGCRTPPGPCTGP